MFKLLFRFSRFWLNYGNPVHILLKRYFAKSGRMTVVDRNTGIRCNCTVGSYQMFGETWYNKDYDIPHFPIRQSDIVIDIGANQGFFTCYAASKGAKVYAFEPFLNSFQTLIENLEINRLVANQKIYSESQLNLIFSPKSILKKLKTSIKFIKK